jgi:hypothetical protein
MDTEYESFFTEAISDEISDEVARSLAADSLEDLPESRDTEQSQPTNTFDAAADAGLSEVVTAPGRISDRYGAMLLIY